MTTIDPALQQALDTIRTLQDERRQALRVIDEALGVKPDSPETLLGNVVLLASKLREAQGAIAADRSSDAARERLDALNALGARDSRTGAPITFVHPLLDATEEARLRAINLSREYDAMLGRRDQEVDELRARVSELEAEVEGYRRRFGNSF